MTVSVVVFAAVAAAVVTVKFTFTEVPSNFVLSAALMLPAADVVAAFIDMAGAVPPELTIGSVPLTEVTVPDAKFDGLLER